MAPKRQLNSLQEHAARIQRHLKDFARQLGISDVLRNKTQELISVLQSEFEQSMTARGRPASLPPTVRQQQMKVASLQHKIRQLKTELTTTQGAKIHGKVHHVWVIRAAVCDPATVPQALSSLCRDFGLTETKTISRNVYWPSPRCHG